MKNIITDTVEEINRLAGEARDHLRDNGWREYDEKLWELVENLQKIAGPGLKPGKHLKWNVADGYAHYIVLKVNKRFTEVAFIDYMDGYRFAGVFQEGNKLMVPTPVAQKMAEWQDRMEVLFKKPA